MDLRDNPKWPDGFTFGANLSKELVESAVAGEEVALVGDAVLRVDLPDDEFAAGGFGLHALRAGNLEPAPDGEDSDWTLVTDSETEADLP